MDTDEDGFPTLATYALSIPTIWPTEHLAGTEPMTNVGVQPSSAGLTSVDNTAATSELTSTYPVDPTMCAQSGLDALRNDIWFITPQPRDRYLHHLQFDHLRYGNGSVHRRVQQPDAGSL